MNPDLIRVYVCGPTVYAPIHLGNARTLVFFDLLIRLLKLIFGNHRVRYVLNITDIDDKIINQARQENVSITNLVTRMIHLFQQNMLDLLLMRPDVQPRVTEHIPQMITFIQSLIDRGYAYIENHNVMFNVGKVAGYGRFAKQNLKQLKTDTRIARADYKTQAEDFVLWKPSLDYGYSSPWGQGRPGWHLECSVLSYEYLGEQYDIHGGGQDLIFPHHQNDIAQSQAVFNQIPAKYWLHTGMLHVNQQKMSKSAGNMINLQEAWHEYCHRDASLLKLHLLLTHYRQPMYFNEMRLQEAADILNKWRQCFNAKQYNHTELYNFLERGICLNTNKKHHKAQTDLTLADLDAEIIKILLNDCNTPLAISSINHHLNSKNWLRDSHKLVKLKNTLNYLGFVVARDWRLTLDAQKLLSQRQKARDEKNYALADTLRRRLNQTGIEVEDNQDGCTCYPCMH